MSDEKADLMQLLADVNAAAQGKRPWFLESRDSERLLSMIMAMAGELAVTRERLDTVERLLAARTLLDRKAIDDYRPDPQAEQERGQWQVEYIARLLRILQQEVSSLQRDAAATGRQVT